jgi:hypothetical protein
VGPSTAPITTTRSNPVALLISVQPATVAEFRAVVVGVSPSIAVTKPSPLLTRI